MDTKVKGKAIQWNDLLLLRQSWSFLSALKEGTSRMALEVEVAVPVYQSMGVDRDSNAVVEISTGLGVSIRDVC